MSTESILELAVVGMMEGEAELFLPTEAAENPAAEQTSDGLPVDAEWVNADVEDPYLWLYRERTVGLLRRYLRLSVEVGRLPSLLGREFFRTRVTSYRAATFEDTVIFVHDVESSLEKLDVFEQQLIATIVLQEYSRWEATRILNCSMRTIGRLLPQALDRITEIFLQGGILEKLVEVEDEMEESCQGGEAEENLPSDWNDYENIFKNLADFPCLV